MAIIKVVNNVFEKESIKTVETKDILVKDFIESNVSDIGYNGNLVECYDCETGKTTYIPLSDEEDSHISVSVLCNGKEVGLDYLIKDSDNILIVVLPNGWFKKAWNRGINQVKKAVLNPVALVTVASAIVVAAMAPFTIPFLLGAAAIYVIGAFCVGLAKDDSPTVTSTAGAEGASQLGVRGSSNTMITNNAYPLVLGKHLITPFVAGSAYSISEGDYGADQYVHVLYCAGYAPLKLTQLKLGDLYLAHNKPNAVNKTQQTVMHGMLKRLSTDTSEAGVDTGDILSRWSNNDISVEILQQSDDRELDYGNVYNESVIQSQVDSTPMFIAEGDIHDLSKKVYKGVLFVNSYRNNTVRFSESYPKKLAVELDFSGGLYKTRSETKNDKSTPKYYSIPCWVAVQWRFHNINDTDSNADDGTGWNSFKVFNSGTEHPVYSKTFTEQSRLDDLSAHSGNSFASSNDINSGWVGCELFNFQDAWNSDEEVNVSEQRYTSYAEISAADCYKQISTNSANTFKGIQVRVIRVSPCYVNETTSKGDNSAYNFNDTVKWNTLTTWKYDNDELINIAKTNPTLTGVNAPVLRPFPEEKMRKLCFISLSAKADASGNISRQLAKLSCVAESFSPTYNEETNEWQPRDVKTIQNYYKPFYINSDGEKTLGEEITREEYESLRQQGIESVKCDNGNDYITQLNTEIFDGANYDTVRNRYFLPESISNKYCDSNSASSFLLAGIGRHNGKEALGYDSFNMMSLSDWYTFNKDVVDGSSYNVDTNETDDLGNIIEHKKGDLVHIKFSANAFIYKALKLDSLLSKIALTGRAAIYRDNHSRISIAIDKPKDYPVLMINQQNCISGSNSISFSEPPSGLQFNFEDEDDEYTTNTIFAMRDGEDYRNPLKEIESYNYDYITNKHQIWSLGRYNIANRILQKKVITRTVGWEGANVSVGDMILVQDDSILTGTDFGGRIKTLIEDELYIYGFVTNEMYHYTGEVDEEGHSLQGVEIFQPKNGRGHNVMTYQLCDPASIVRINDYDYFVPKGETNLVLFRTKIAKEDYYTSDDVFLSFYKPSVDNIVSFGYLGKITEKYIVQKVTPSKKFNYTITAFVYNEDLYNYGRTLPVFQNNITIPKTDGDSFNLSNTLTLPEIQATSTATANASVSNITTGVNIIPSAVEKCTVNAFQDYISIKAEYNTTFFTTGVVKNIKWKLYKGADSEPIEFVSDDKETEYRFNRSIDNYPESSELSTWYVVAIVENCYGNVSEPSRSFFVDTSTYGTWTVQAPIYTTRISDRTITLILSQPTRSDSKEVYGNVKYQVSVGLAEESKFYTPATSENPYESESNYKAANAVENGYVTSEGTYVQTMPLQGQQDTSTQDGKGIIDTPYSFKVRAVNSTDNGTVLSASDYTIIQATALCTSIRDIVKANEDAKQMYISSLSAISANIGVIQKGSLSGSNNNYWALSNIDAIDNNGRQMYEGEFRVGGQDEYLKVTPKLVNNGITGYTIAFKVGNFEVTSVASSINGELIIQDNADSLDRTRISPTGVYFEHRQTPELDWVQISAQDVNGVNSSQLYSDQSLVVSNQAVRNRRINKTDIGIPYLSDDSEVYHFDTDFNNQYQLQTITIEGLLDVDGNDTKSYGLYGTGDVISGIDFTPAILCVAPYSNIGKSIYGQYSLTRTLSSVNVYTIDFWIQYLYSENQILFTIGNDYDKISLRVQNRELFFNELLNIRSINDFLFNIESAETISFQPYKISDDYYFEDGYNAKESTELAYNARAVESFNDTFKYYQLINGEYVRCTPTVYTYDDYVLTGLYKKSIAYNQPDGKAQYLIHTTQSGKETKTFEELELAFNENQWLHFGIIQTEKSIYVCIDKTVVPFVRGATGSRDVEISLNSTKKSFILDELMIDENVAENVEDFKSHTTTRIPFGALDLNDQWFILETEKPENVKTNLFESEVFKSKMNEFLASSEFATKVKEIQSL